MPAGSPHPSCSSCTCTSASPRPPSDSITYRLPCRQPSTLPPVINSRSTHTSRRTKVQPEPSAYWPSYGRMPTPILLGAETLRAAAERGATLRYTSPLVESDQYM